VVAAGEVSSFRRIYRIGLRLRTARPRSGSDSCARGNPWTHNHSGLRSPMMF
jgi:hypothetical protein